MEEKRTYGRIVIDNSGTPEETERQVRYFWEREIKGAATSDQLAGRSPSAGKGQ
jgi:dephospho-CoA kinase